MGERGVRAVVGLGQEEVRQRRLQRRCESQEELVSGHGVRPAEIRGGPVVEDVILAVEMPFFDEVLLQRVRDEEVGVSRLAKCGFEPGEDQRMLVRCTRSGGHRE